MPDKKTQGFALILVVWVLALLSAMAMSFTGHIRTGSGTLATATGLYRAKALSDAALQRGIHALFNPGQTTSWKIDGQEYAFDYAGAKLSFSIQSEGGKIDLNMGSDELLLGLFEYGLEERQDISSEELLDQLRDWQDDDDLSRLNGAEFNDYELDNAGYGPSNQPLRSILEIQQLKSMDQAIVRRILPAVTVYSHKATLNPAHAGEAALRALPGVRAADVDDLLEDRQMASFMDRTEAVPTITGGAEYLDNDTVTVYTVTGRAKLPSGQSYQRKAVVWLGKEDQKSPLPGQLPYWVLEER